LAGLPQPDIAPPIPIQATVDIIPAVVTFDRALQPGLITPTNWAYRFANIRYPGFNVIASANLVTINPGDGESDPGPNVVSYSATTPDVLSLAGVPAAAFEDFPIT
jgi:hypothetical protein